LRRFLVLVHRVPEDGDFSLNDLANGGGRMDEVAQVVGAAFLVSNGLRRDTELDLLLLREGGRGRRVHLVGQRLRYLNPDERSTAALLKNALVRAAGHNDRTLETSPGVFVGPGTEEDLVSFLRMPGAFWAEEGGVPIRRSPLGPEVAGVLGDVFDPSPRERELLVGSGVPRVRLGPRPLRASQCMVLLQNELDLREEGAPEGPA
jgi:tRNA (pseudouridine54-N1)-methyltransferase